MRVNPQQQEQQLARPARPEGGPRWRACAVVPVLGILFTLCVFALRLRLAPGQGAVVRLDGADRRAPVLVLFGMAWAGSSFVEGIPASGAMALTLFTGPGIIAMTLAWRYWVAPGLKAKG